jgi:hypothetical protein
MSAGASSNSDCPIARDVDVWVLEGERLCGGVVHKRHVLLLPTFLGDNLCTTKPIVSDVGDCSITRHDIIAAE